jgi:hypothetical protein
MPEEYPIVRDLTETDRQWLDDGKRYASALHQRYVPTEKVDITPESMDRVYKAWCDDQRSDMPPLQSLYQGFGYVLGEMFRERFGHEWKMVTTQFGSEVSLYSALPSATHRDSVLSPLSMVAKRIRDGQPFFADVFHTLVAQLGRDGFSQKNADPAGTDNDGAAPRRV